MKFTVLTIFPELFATFREHGIVKRAIDGEKIAVDTINVRDFTADRHRTTDDRPYGGGCGMVMKPEPLAGAIRAAKKSLPDAKVLSLTPQGKRFDQAVAGDFAEEAGLIIVCGRYEGIDERICEHFIDDEISIGDYVLTGGEVAAMVIIDAVTRLIPGTLGGAESAEKDSFANGLLEHAHYTRPRLFEGEPVPDVLLSGNHRVIEQWRTETSLMRTLLKRPDLLVGRAFDRREIEALQRWRAAIDKMIASGPRDRKKRCGAVKG